MAKKKTVVIGLLGPNLDAGRKHERWGNWRPTVSVCQQEDLVVDRFELIHERKFGRLAQQVREDMESISPETVVHSHTVDWGDPWDFEEVFDVLIEFAANYNFQPAKENYLIHITTGTHVAQICLFLLTETRHLPGLLLQTAPPSKGDDGPGKHYVVDLDRSRYDRIAQRFAKEQTDAVSFLKSGIETRDDAFNALIEQIEHVAIHAREPLLLTGPTGAGKSQLARRIYELKHSRHQVEGAFVEINCATLRGDAAMSALFGHVKGAFTGAVKDRPGLLREANGGMLFLDEIGELGADEQAMLLRALEEKTFLPVGADKETSSDFQLIAGSNRDLAAETTQGNFRADLLARINLWHFALPGLRERPSDIEPNLDYELEQFTAATGRRVTMSAEARKKFLKFATAPEAVWPANFRDLNAAVTRMATLADGGRITPAVMQAELARLQVAWGASAKAPHPHIRNILGEEKLAELDLFDRAQLEEVLRVAHQSSTLTEAGRRLFAISRTRKTNPNDADRLRKYLMRFDLKFGDLK